MIYIREVLKCNWAEKQVLKSSSYSNSLSPFTPHPRPPSITEESGCM